VHESHDSWHLGWWPLKSFMWITLMVVLLFVPSAFIQFYGEYTLIKSLQAISIV